MGPLSHRHLPGAFSNAPGNSTDLELDLDPEGMTISEMFPMSELGLSMHFPELPRGASSALFLPGRAMLDSWILVDCGSEGVRPRRVHDRPVLWGRKPTRH